MASKKATPVPPPDGAAVIRTVLQQSLPRPGRKDTPEEKGQYAVRFAERMAERLAGDLDGRLSGITASPARTAVSAGGPKQLDVNFSTPALGLGLGISLKSVHIEDVETGRYTHNKKRNEEELRIEASGYHKRQPFAVMVGVLFLPFESCDDAKTKTKPSSFGSWVKHLRPYAGRNDTKDEHDRFEKLYIALYQADGSDLRFFDVESDPPKHGRPRMNGDLLGNDGRALRALTYAEFLDAIHHEFLRRNDAEFRWADAGDDPLKIV